MSESSIDKHLHMCTDCDQLDCFGFLIAVTEDKYFRSVLSDAEFCHSAMHSMKRGNYDEKFCLAIKTVLDKINTGVYNSKKTNHPGFVPKTM
jgi:hypothetical protein